MRGCLMSVLVVPVVLLLAAIAAAGDYYAPSYAPRGYYAPRSYYGRSYYSRPTLYRSPQAYVRPYYAPQVPLFRVWFRAAACDPWQLAGRFVYSGDAQLAVFRLESSGYQVAVN